MYSYGPPSPATSGYIFNIVFFSVVPVIFFLSIFPIFGCCTVKTAFSSNVSFNNGDFLLISNSNVFGTMYTVIVIIFCSLSTSTLMLSELVPVVDNFSSLKLYFAYAVSLFSTYPVGTANSSILNSKSPSCFNFSIN